MLVTPARTRRLGLVASLTLVAGLSTVAPSSAADEASEATCQVGPVQENTREDNQAPVAVADTATARAGTISILDVLGNDSDPDEDDLTVVSVSAPLEGSEACPTVSTSGQVLLYAALREADYTETFRYGVTDGERLRQATVTVSVDGVARTTASLRKKLVLTKRGKVKTPAEVVVSNPNDVAVLVLAGNASLDDYTIQRTVPAKGSTTIKTGVKKLEYLALLDDQDQFAPINVGTVDTRSGKTTNTYIGDEVEAGRYAARTRAARQAWAR